MYKVNPNVLADDKRDCGDRGVQIKCGDQGQQRTLIQGQKPVQGHRRRFIGHENIESEPIQDWKDAAPSPSVNQYLRLPVGQHLLNDNDTGIYQNKGANLTQRAQKDAKTPRKLLSINRSNLSQQKTNERSSLQNFDDSCPDDHATNLKQFHDEIQQQSVIESFNDDIELSVNEFKATTAGRRSPNCSFRSISDHMSQLFEFHMQLKQYLDTLARNRLIKSDSVTSQLVKTVKDITKQMEIRLEQMVGIQEHLQTATNRTTQTSKIQKKSTVFNMLDMNQSLMNQTNYIGKDRVREKKNMDIGIDHQIQQRNIVSQQEEIGNNGKSWFGANMTASPRRPLDEAAQRKSPLASTLTTSNSNEQAEYLQTLSSAEPSDFTKIERSDCFQFSIGMETSPNRIPASKDVDFRYSSANKLQDGSYKFKNFKSNIGQYNAQLKVIHKSKLSTQGLSFKMHNRMFSKQCQPLTCRNNEERVGESIQSTMFRNTD